MLVSDRLPPHDINAEESVLGSILINNEAFITVSNILKTDDFYREKNKWVYEAILELFDRGEAIDQVTVANELVNQDNLEQLGGSNYLAYLVSSVPSSVHVEEYANVVAKTAQLRQLIRAGSDIVDIGFIDTSDVSESLSRAEKILFNLKEGRASEDFTHIRDVLEQYMQETAKLKGDPDSALSPVTTGFVDMDRILGGGLQNSDLIVLAARPSLGKSTLAFNIAKEASLNGSIVGIFSLEMSKTQIGMRMLASESGVNATKIRRGLITDTEEQSILNSIGLLSGLDIYIDDSPFLEVFQIHAKARRLYAERGLDLIIVDYMQLLNISGRSDNRVQVMSEISRALKGLARDLDIPVLALSQLSRAVEQRQSHIPVLSDLRESGSIEQDADVVAFIYRADLYTKEEEWENSPQNMGIPYPKNIAQIIISKHRNGPVGEFPLYFRDDVIKFESITRPIQQASMD